MTGSWCDNCAKPLPGGCLHLYGSQQDCAVGPRHDPAWIVGMALWKDLTDRRGVKWELDRCEDHVKVEIIETLGRIAIEAVALLRPLVTGAEPPDGGAE